MTCQNANGGQSNDDDMLIFRNENDKIDLMCCFDQIRVMCCFRLRSA